jgi:uncharacterized protein
MPAKKRRQAPAKQKRKSAKATRKPRVATVAPSVAAGLIEVRNSAIHGSGVYALRPIRKGTRIIEYVGDRVSHATADRRYARKTEADGHTFLFIVDDSTVIDAGIGGNEARFINHHCDPNCETVTYRRRVYVEAIRNIKPGDELGYDYQLTWDSTDEPEEIALYACRCGAKACRGSMLDVEPLDKKPTDSKK